jgi:hypothetical protein
MISHALIATGARHQTLAFRTRPRQRPLQVARSWVPPTRSYGFLKVVGAAHEVLRGPVPFLIVSEFVLAYAVALEHARLAGPVDFAGDDSLCVGGAGPRRPETGGSLRFLQNREVEGLGYASSPEGRGEVDEAGCG